MKRLYYLPLITLLLCSATTHALEKDKQDKKEPNAKETPKMTQAIHEPNIKFTKGTLVLFASPLQLDNESGKPWSERAYNQNTNLYCRAQDLYGDIVEGATYDFSGQSVVESLVPCDPSRFFGNAGTKISLYYIDKSELSPVKKIDQAATKIDEEITKANQALNKAKGSFELATLEEEARTKLFKASGKNEIPAELSAAKDKVSQTKKELEIAEANLILAEIEKRKAAHSQAASISAKTNSNTEEVCSGFRELPDVLGGIKETERPSLISMQVKHIVTAVSGIDSKSLQTDQTESSWSSQKARQQKTCAWLWTEYTLGKNRAIVETTTKDPFIKTDKVFDYTVVTGSKENYFLSVDANLSDLKQVKDAVKNNKDVAKKAERLFIGLNYMLGDVYAPLPKWHYKRLVIKAMVTPNQNFDSYGVGLGYRLPISFESKGKKDSEENSGFVIYYGSFWTRPANPLDHDSGRVRANSWGVSYSLGSALEWLTPKK